MEYCTKATVKVSDHSVGVSDSVKYEEEFFLNSRGMKLFTCKWLPVQQEIKSLVFLCHGYAMECSVFMKGTALRLAQAGFAVFGIDYEGHGKSEGQRCFINQLYDVIDDCAAFFKSVRDLEEYNSKAGFLLGESMGGAVALLIHLKQPHDWNGAVLVAPMCKIAEKLKPPPAVSYILTKLANLIPTWKVVPSKDVLEIGYRDHLKRAEIRTNPYIYQGRPRLKTASELLRISQELEQRVDEITLPFLVLHGEDDVVIDPAISRTLYDSANSFDKTLEMYPGMWHGLLAGEPDENIEIVLKDIVAWLNIRSYPAASLTANPLRRLDLADHSLKKDLISMVRDGDANTHKLAQI